MRAGDPVVFIYDEPELGLAGGTHGTLTAIRTSDDVDFETDDGREFTTDLDMLNPLSAPPWPPAGSERERP
ncbi:hypothetical protein BS329_18080 [Amycolatopsis coloradensis]|uniref:DUF4926 domain-containing protein n=1 Tax=Amycolatopsis coloradensis TaxID=76021 RepID=A0A1R0KTC3_9PSEU|nr:hypothetical protein [Amycolatopsis coloradensis]OLZ51149.1 hypothetical protein BS329_18080 [Amycolatopsis coloradensis]